MRKMAWIHRMANRVPVVFPLPGDPPNVFLKNGLQRWRSGQCQSRFDPAKLHRLITLPQGNPGAGSPAVAQRAATPI